MHCPDQVLDIGHREIEIRLRDKHNRIYAAPADMYFSKKYSKLFQTEMNRHQWCCMGQKNCCKDLISQS